MPWYPFGGGGSSRSGSTAGQNNFYELGSRRGRDQGTSSGDAALDELNAINDVARVGTAAVGNVNKFLVSISSNPSKPMTVAGIGGSLVRKIGSLFSSSTINSTSTDTSRTATKLGGAVGDLASRISKEGKQGSGGIIGKFFV